jgi:hypothetical protein
MNLNEIYPVYATRRNQTRKILVPPFVEYNNYYINTPLWSSPYTFCRFNADCNQNTVDSRRCMSMEGDKPCSFDHPCICSAAVHAPF